MVERLLSLGHIGFARYSKIVYFSLGEVYCVEICKEIDFCKSKVETQNTLILPLNRSDFFKKVISI